MGGVGGATSSVFCRVSPHKKGELGVTHSGSSDEWKKVLMTLFVVIVLGLNSWSKFWDSWRTTIYLWLQEEIIGWQFQPTPREVISGAGTQVCVLFVALGKTMSLNICTYDVSTHSMCWNMESLCCFQIRRLINCGGCFCETWFLG